MTHAALPCNSPVDPSISFVLKRGSLGHLAHPMRATYIPPLRNAAAQVTYLESRSASGEYGFYIRPELWMAWIRR
jgi:hypothetical protein